MNCVNRNDDAEPIPVSSDITSTRATSLLLHERASILLQLNAPPLVRTNSKYSSVNKIIPTKKKESKRSAVISSSSNYDTLKSHHEFVSKHDTRYNCKKTMPAEIKTKTKRYVVKNDDLTGNLYDLKHHRCGSDRWDEMLSTRPTENTVEASRKDRSEKEKLKNDTAQLIELQNTKNKMLKEQLECVKEQIKQLHDIVSKLQEDTFYGRFKCSSSVVSNKKSNSRRQKKCSRMEKKNVGDEQTTCNRGLMCSTQALSRSNSRNCYQNQKQIKCRPRYVQDTALENGNDIRLPLLRRSVPDEIDVQGGSQHTVGAISTTTYSSWRDSDWSVATLHVSEDEDDTEEERRNENELENNFTAACLLQTYSTGQIGTVGPVRINDRIDSSTNEEGTCQIRGISNVRKFDNTTTTTTSIIPRSQSDTLKSCRDEFFRNVQGKVVYIDNIDLPSLSQCCSKTASTYPSTSNTTCASENYENLDSDVVHLINFSNAIPENHFPKTSTDRNDVNNFSSIATETIERTVPTLTNESITDPYMLRSSTIHTVTEYEMTDTSGEKGVYTGSVSTLTLLPHGFGRLECIRTSGEFYEGYWNDGKRCGFGQASHGQNYIYEGQFRNDLKHGYGKIYDTAGCIFEGQFRYGVEVHARMNDPTGSICVESSLDRTKQNTCQ